MNMKFFDVITQILCCLTHFMNITRRVQEPTNRRAPLHLQGAKTGQAQKSLSCVHVLKYVRGDDNADVSLILMPNQPVKKLLIMR